MRELLVLWIVCPIALGYLLAFYFNKYERKPNIPDSEPSVSWPDKLETACDTEAAAAEVPGC